MRWPFMLRRTHELRMALLTQRHRDEREVMQRRLDEAREHADEVIGAMGILGERYCGDDPDLIRAAQDHLNAVLTRLVQWRETRQGGGMMGQGWHRRVTALAAFDVFGLHEARPTDRGLRL